MAIGKVKWFNANKGFGIIESDNDGEIFVHYSEIKLNGVKALRENQEVEFEIIKGEHNGEKSFLAKNVFPK